MPRTPKSRRSAKRRSSTRSGSACTSGRPSSPAGHELRHHRREGNMKIHTDTLTSSQLYAAKHGLPIYLESVRVGSRSRKNGFIVHLSADKDENHHFNTNPGGRYPDDRVGDAAATWDEWGIW